MTENKGLSLGWIIAIVGISAAALVAVLILVLKPYFDQAERAKYGGLLDRNDVDAEIEAQKTIEVIDLCAKQCVEKCGEAFSIGALGGNGDTDAEQTIRSCTHSCTILCSR